MRDKFISEGKRLAGVMELLILEKNGGKEKGKGLPSSYTIGEDLGPLLESEDSARITTTLQRRLSQAARRTKSPTRPRGPARESETQPGQERTHRTQAVW